MTNRQELIRSYLHKVKSANKERTKIDHFKDLLNRLYSGDKEIEKIIDSISSGTETTILNIPRKDRLHKGSADTLYNKIIIEFENDLRVTLKHAKEQLAGYLLGKFNSGEGYNFILIASDLITWKVFSPDLACLEKITKLTEDQLILNEVKSASFSLTERNADVFYYWIDRFLFREEKQKATLKKIEEAFGYQSNVFIECYRQLTDHFNSVKKFGEVQVSFEQWNKFLSIAYGSFDATEENFQIHTYLSIFSKMLAYAFVSNDDYIDDEELKSIIDGSIFHRFNIQNFVDKDFFHWVKSDRNFRALKKVFRLIAQEISTFDFHEVDEDILKGVYQELIDHDTRHTLGEYYTPDWLCERIIREFEFKSGDRILDPACGSGSFLRTAVHRIRELNPGISVDEVNSMVYGIDIHPLSVQIAKTTMLLALGKEIVNSRKPVHLNIIQANTLLAPDGVDDLFGTSFKINIDKERLELNSQILSDIKLFDDALEICDELAEQSMNGKEITLETFTNILMQQNKSAGFSIQIIDSFYKIYEGLKKVKERGRDSIWKFIVQNLYKPYFLKNKFDYVIGNPPWFTYSSIRNMEYQDTLNKLADTYAVKPERIANFPHLEIAAIFLAYCSSYFLKGKGRIAFVLPRSFISADHHDNSRSGKAKGFKLKNVWDLDNVSPLFRIPSCVIFTEKAKDKDNRKIPAGGIEGKVFKGNLPAHNCNLKDAKDKLNEEETEWYYVKQGNASALSNNKTKSQNLVNPYKNAFKQGATIVPRAFYFVELDQEIPEDFNDRIINIKTSEAVKADAKEPWKKLSFSGRIESRFLFRTALAKSILPFALYKPDLVVLPVTICNNEDKKVVKLYSAVELLREGFIFANRWFRDTEFAWDAYKTEKSAKMKSNDRLNYQRGLTEQNKEHKYLVLYTTSGKDANAICLLRNSLEQVFMIDHKTYWFSTNVKSEAYYLTGILNSSIPNMMMKDFQSKGLFGARDVHKKILDIYFPKFDENNPDHLRLAELSKAAHEKAAQYLIDNPPQKELTAIYLGRLRIAIKLHLKNEIEEIDNLVKELL